MKHLRAFSLHSPHSSDRPMLLSFPPSLRPPRADPRRISTLARHRSAPDSIRFFSLSTAALNGSSLTLLSADVHSDASLHSHSSPTPRYVRNLGFPHRNQELGILSLTFVISMIVGSFLSLAVISLPALSAFRRLAVSMDKLSKVVSEEVPGTLSSLKLSGLEINDLTCQLNYLRQRISGNQTSKSHGGTSNPIIN